MTYHIMELLLSGLVLPPRSVIVKYYCVLLVLCTQLWLTDSAATITSQSEDKTASPGHFASFRCDVSNQGSDVVQWWFLTQNVLISSNDVLTYETEKYSITVDVLNGGYNLNVFHISSEDHGVYKCLIAGTSTSLISHLYVAGNPNYPTIDPNAAPANFTDCCIEEQVSSYCISLCSPSTFDSTHFDSSRCAYDLLKLIKCGADGRSHVTCCRERMLPNICLDYCMGAPPTEGNISEHSVCLDKAVEIIHCYEEGQHILPSPPHSPQVLSTSPTSLTVSWNIPFENGDQVKGYRVFYQQDGSTEYKTIDPLDFHASSYTIEKLQPATTYNVYVIAFNEHGSSLPSYIIKSRTNSENQLPPGTSQDSLMDCCQRRSVSSKCQSFLCGGLYVPLTPQDKLQCYTEVDRVYSCLSEEKDHTDCCTQKGVEPRCLTLCEGHLITTVFQNLDCLDKYISDVASCIQANKGTLPGPPMNIKVVEVTATDALIKWDPPANHSSDKIIEYIVLYKEFDGFFYQKNTVNDLKIPLTRLFPNTMYEVMVESVSTHGSSLPSQTIVFLTYMEHGGVELPSGTTALMPTGAPPHNVMHCCVDNGLQPRCLSMCDYNSTFTQVDTELYLSCENYLGHVLACGVDGRNHESCCKRRGVIDQCLRFCSFSHEDALNFKFTIADIVCVPYLENVVQCMQEGVAMIPSSPLQLTLVEVTEHTVSIKWMSPAQGANQVSGYIISMEDKNATNIGKSYRTNNRQFIVQNLLPHHDYEIQVYAYSDAGESLPSEGLLVRTRPTDYIHEINVTVVANFTECCQAQNLSEECLPACSGSNLVNLHKCGGQMAIILKCASDKRDHKPCCSDRLVATHCLPFCEGKIEVKDFNTLLCLAYTEQMLACFHEGYDKLPRMPELFHVLEIASRYVKLGWEEPTSMEDGLKYFLYYRTETSTEPYKLMEDVNSPHMVTGLLPFKHYNIYIVAVNNYGSSLPTAIISIWTLMEEGPNVQVHQEPSGVVKEGTTTVVLICQSDTEPAPEIYWKRKDVRHENPYILDQVSESDVGRYTCVAKSGKNSLTYADLYLYVSYRIKVTAVQSTVEVPPYKGMTAGLHCDFYGHPDQITWFFNGQNRIPPFNDTSNRFTVRRSINLDEGFISSSLVISNIRREDYGMYSCTGTNEFGMRFAPIELVNPESDLTAPVTPAPPIQDVKACCDINNVTPQCLVACSFDVDFSQIMELPDPLECLNDLPTITGCAADGRNHTQCCVNKDVPSECLPFCMGIVKELDESHVACISHYETIINCMEEGIEKIPTAPRALQGKVNLDGFIQVWWESPLKHPEYVTYYDIHYRSGVDDKNRVETVSHQVKHVILKAIHSNTKYRIYVLARNHHGQSHPSNNITIQTQDLIPSNPVNLLGTLTSSGTDIQLTWDPPKQNPGAVTMYVIYYSVVGESIYKQTSTDKVYFQLGDLDINTNFEIYVTAKTQNIESEKSNVIIVRTSASTKNEENTVTARMSGGSTDAIGIGVGVAVAIVVLALVFVAIAFYLFKMRNDNKHHRFQDSSSVTFENSGFHKHAHIQISGMPGEATPYSDANLQSSDYVPSPQHGNNSSIMKELPTSESASNGTDIVLPSNSKPNATLTAINPLYATLDVGQSALDTRDVGLDEKTGEATNTGFDKSGMWDQ